MAWKVCECMRFGGDATTHWATSIVSDARYWDQICGPNDMCGLSWHIAVPEQSTGTVSKLLVEIRWSDRDVSTWRAAG